MLAALTCAFALAPTQAAEKSPAATPAPDKTAAAAPKKPATPAAENSPAAAPEKSAAAGPRVFVLDGAAILDARRRAAAGDKEVVAAIESLRREADKALKAGPFSVTEKKDTPPSGDKHDYMSVAPYYWPDPSKPDGKPYIQRDGEVNPDRGGGDNTQMGGMTHAVGRLAAGWHFTGDERYAEHAAKLLRAWFLDEKTRMNPNLNFAQSVPGRSDGRGTGIIDTVCLIELVDSVGLLGGSKAWTAADQKGLEEWFGKFVGWLEESKNGRAEARAHNNHGTWYDAQISIYAFFAGKPDVAKRVLAESSKRIDAQIKADGQQPAELARTKSWNYSIYNLRAWFIAARLGEHVGVDLWKYQSPDGGSIRKALDWLLPLAKDPSKWTTKQIVKLKPEELAPLLRTAAAEYHDPKYAEAAREISPAAPDWRERLLGLRP
jgi:hypothetical protein